MPSIAKNVEQPKILYTLGESINWYNNFEK